MKSTGIVRKVDDLGRIVLPKELRKVLNIDEHSSLEIFVEGDMVMLQKYEPTCVFCGGSSNVITYKNKNICKACVHDLTR